jgi:8-oxo-dGTP diphosphatase
MTRVAVGVIKQNGKFLVCQRKKGGRYGLKWEFPGGKLEQDEDVEQCLRRELREELSIEIDGNDRIETLDAYYDDGGLFRVSYCFVTGFTGIPQNNAFEQIRWVSLAELKEMDMLEGNKPFIASFLQV